MQAWLCPRLDYVRSQKWKKVAAKGSKIDFAKNGKNLFAAKKYKNLFSKEKKKPQFRRLK